jgi:hypothetical protein
VRLLRLTIVTVAGAWLYYLAIGLMFALLDVDFWTMPEPAVLATCVFFGCVAAAAAGYFAARFGGGDEWRHARLVGLVIALPAALNMATRLHRGMPIGWWLPATLVLIGPCCLLGAALYELNRQQTAQEP